MVIAQVIALSDGLNLNEFDCVDLLWRAYQQVLVGQSPTPEGCGY